MYIYVYIYSPPPPSMVCETHVGIPGIPPLANLFAKVRVVCRVFLSLFKAKVEWFF